MARSATEYRCLKADPGAKGLLLDIDRFATHDGPGIRTVVFLKGCPLACRWCHSPESQSPRVELLYQPARCDGCWLCLDECPQSALSRDEGRGTKDGAAGTVALDRAKCDACGRCADVCYTGALKLLGREVTAGEVAADVAKDLPFYRSSGGGVTLSGGEPARQPAFSYSFLSACKEAGIHTAVETTGHARGEVMAALSEVTDLFLYDVKAVTPALHREHTGVPNRVILSNLQRLVATGAGVVARVPCIPGVNDGEDEIRAIARFVAGAGVRRIDLLPYNSSAGAKYEWIGRAYAFPANERQSDEYIARLADTCRAEGLEARVGG